MPLVLLTIKVSPIIISLRRQKEFPMKLKQILIVFTLVMMFPGLQAQMETPDNCTSGILLNTAFPKAAVLQAVLDKYTAAGVPGVSIAVYNEDLGWWTGVSGYARIESKTPMTPCHLQYLQSVSKTYMAVTILQLVEKGKLELDHPITRYLPAKYSRFIPNADSISIHMLLNHTSGVPEYNTQPRLVSKVLLNPTRILKVEEVLECLAGEPAQFPPGARHSYANTNYLLLALVADVVTGNHAKFMSENIFKPLGLRHTFYRNEKGYPDYPELVDSYWDVLNTGRPANITPMQRSNVASLIGDDGIVCTPIDVVLFLEGLMEGKLISRNSLELMQQWVKNSKGEPTYGLGLYHYNAGGLEGVGHGGGGIGAGCVLLYVPTQKTYVFIGVNIGVLIESNLSKKCQDMRDELLMALFM